jgi:hypothetical protein
MPRTRGLTLLLDTVTPPKQQRCIELWQRCGWTFTFQGLTTVCIAFLLTIDTTFDLHIKHQMLVGLRHSNDFFFNPISISSGLGGLLTIDWNGTFVTCVPQPGFQMNRLFVKLTKTETNQRTGMPLCLRFADHAYGRNGYRLAVSPGAHIAKLKNLTYTTLVRKAIDRIRLS